VGRYGSVRLRGNATRIVARCGPKPGIRTAPGNRPPEIRSASGRSHESAPVRRGSARSRRVGRCRAAPPTPWTVALSKEDGHGGRRGAPGSSPRAVRPGCPPGWLSSPASVGDRKRSPMSNGGTAGHLLAVSRRGCSPGALLLPVSDDLPIAFPASAEGLHGEHHKANPIGIPNTISRTKTPVCCCQLTTSPLRRAATRAPHTAGHTAAAPVRRTVAATAIVDPERDPPRRAPRAAQQIGEPLRHPAGPVHVALYRGAALSSSSTSSASPAR